ncbi:tRNA(Met) cytidine acetyltransferase, partial [Salmonella enterica subsp. enterica]|nr:tRNA(Met) cytidine acetyltransferase [Salmonella enterica subsp. enterica]
MSDIDALQALTSQMTQEGIRRLLVISGDAAWCRERAEAIRAALPGDWLWVAPDAPAQPRCTPQALQTLLGREFRHAIFDAWQGFDAAAFAALSGTLQAGSWLLLLMPPYETWESRPDTDSLRWSDCAQPIPTPQFAQHLKRTLSRDPQTLLWRQRQPFCWPSYPTR